MRRMKTRETKERLICKILNSVFFLQNFDELFMKTMKPKYMSQIAFRIFAENVGDKDWRLLMMANQAIVLIK